MACTVERRYVLISMITLGFFNITLLRTNISVAIVSMVNSTTLRGSNSTIDECFAEDDANTETQFKEGEFQWSSVDQGLVLGCYFYGYVVSSIPGSWIANKFGFKYVVGICMTLSSVLTILGPAMAYSSLRLFVAGRIVLGFLQGATIPTCVTAFPVWVPPAERNILFAVTFIGFSTGAFITLPLAGFITAKLGWETVFYVTGLYTLVWSCFWFALVHDTPQKHPRISLRERQYIERKLAEQATTSQQDSKAEKIPWMGILTSTPVWAAIFSHVAYDWTFNTAALLLPTYMSRIMKLNITEAGASAGLPYLIMGFVSILGGIIVDAILRKKLMSRTHCRKFYILIALLVPALFIVLASHAGCNKALGTFYFVVAVSVLGLHVPGTEANFFDLSPVYCGILFGINGAVSTSMGFLAPLIAGWILYPDASLLKWRTVFWTTAGINVSAAAVYLIFGSGVEQKWSRSLENQTDDSKQEEELLKTKDSDALNASVTP